MARLRPLHVLVMAAALMASACGFGGNGDQLTVSAVFDDVIDLVPQAHVRAGDVPIGVVSGIELTDDNLARVTMRIKDGTGLPADTIAVLSKTSLLGERYVDLRPPDDGGAGALRDGQEIVQTQMVTDFEELVQTGGDLLAFVSADRLSAAIQTGARAFGGEGSVLGQFLTDVEAFVGRYDESTDDLLALIDSLDALTAEYAQNADANAAVLADLEQASVAFEQIDTELLDTLDRLADLSRLGGRVLNDNQDELENLIRRIRILLGELTRVEGALRGTLTWFPRHNIWVPLGEKNEETQVWLDFILCGVNDVDGDPSRDCTPPNPNQQSQGPGYHPYPEECWEDKSRCPDEPYGG
jgi:phospholipid/cholesterol/gamma-HCH transport system substrate-binding protein